MSRDANRRVTFSSASVYTPFSAEKFDMWSSHTVLESAKYIKPLRIHSNILIQLIPLCALNINNADISRA
jgi:hypothetical protein